MLQKPPSGGFCYTGFMKNVKVWGVAHHLFENPNTEVHYIQAKKGGYSSRHHHVTKHNKFFVISGRLKITIFQNSADISNETILSEGESIDIPPVLDHKFEAMEDTQAIEVYWGDQLEKEDIVRKDEGGLIE